MRAGDTSGLLPSFLLFRKSGDRQYQQFQHRLRPDFRYSSLDQQHESGKGPHGFELDRCRQQYCRSQEATNKCRESVFELPSTVRRLARYLVQSKAHHCRKARCDGNKPSCKTCLVYNVGYKQPPPPTLLLTFRTSVPGATTTMDGSLPLGSMSIRSRIGSRH